MKLKLGWGICSHWQKQAHFFPSVLMDRIYDTVIWKETLGIFKHLGKTHPTSRIILLRTLVWQHLFDCMFEGGIFKKMLVKNQ